MSQDRNDVVVSTKAKRTGKVAEQIKSAFDEGYKKGFAEGMVKADDRNAPMLAADIHGLFVSGTGKCPVCGIGHFYSNVPGQRTTNFCDNCGQALRWS